LLFSVGRIFPDRDSLGWVTRGAGAAVVAAAAFLVPAAAGNLGADTANATVSPSLTAHRATLTLKLHYEMTCRQPGAGPVFVHLPAKMGVPQTTAGTYFVRARVNGHAFTAQLAVRS
jgi:hypothetical protein